MPIQQISSRPSAPLLGKIRLGVRTENNNGREFPSNVEHFVLTEVPEVARVYGNDPKEIDIMFPSDDLEVVLPTYLEWWTKGKKGADGKVIAGTLMCKGNGPDENNNPGIAQYFAKRDMVTGIVPTRSCMGSSCPDWVDDRGSSKCKQTMRVTVFLPRVSPYGVYMINTTSWNSIKSFHDQIRWIQELNGGHFRLIPLKIVREEMVVKHVDKKTGKEITKNMWIMKLKPNPEFFEKYGEEAKQLVGAFNAGLRYLLPSAEEVQATGMEDHFPVVDAEAAPAQTALASSEEVAKDSEVNALFDELQALSGKQFPAKARLISIRKKEGETDVKGAVVATLRQLIADAKRQAANTVQTPPTDTQQQTVEAPQQPSEPVVQQVIDSQPLDAQPDESGIL